MRPFAALIIFLVLNVAQCYTNFIHLFGYTLNGNTLKKVSAATPNECGTECVLTKNCTGFQMLFGTGYCNLLSMLRNYKVDLEECSYFLKQSANVTVTGRKLTSNIDIALQNAVYDSQLKCPDGWTYTSVYPLLSGVGPTCATSMSQSVCNQYASFFQATFSKYCLMTPWRVTYNCPDSTYTLGNYTDGRYCLKVIPKRSDETEMVITNPYETANQYCFDQTGGYLASIHSAAENNAVNGNSFLTKMTETVIAQKHISAMQKKVDATSSGVMICLVASSSTITDTDEMYWLDGTDVSYTNYGANFTSDEFTYTLLTTNGQWQSVFDPTGSIFKYIACKQGATATMSPM